MASSVAQPTADDHLLVVLEFIRAASAAESRGQLHDAVCMFGFATRRAQALIPSLPRAHAEILRRHLLRVRERCDLLLGKTTRAAVATSTLLIPAHSVPFEPASCSPPAAAALSVAPWPALEEPHHTLRLWRHLGESMQHGALIGPSVYMPRAAWFQSGGTAVVRGLNAKVKFLTGLAEDFERLRVDDSAPAATAIAALDRFLGDVQQRHAAFAADVGSSGDGNPRNRVDRGVRELIHRGGFLKGWQTQQDATQSNYVAWTVNVLLQARALERVLLRFPARLGVGPAIHDRVAVAVSDRHLGAVTRFLLRDAAALLERHMSSMRAACCELVPEGVELK